jgi:ribosome biogenesis GTPase A
MQRYKLTAIPDKQIGIIEEIGRRRGCLVSGGEVDLHRAAELVLRELRAGKLGRISLERPQETDTAFDRGVESE